MPKFHHHYPLCKKPVIYSPDSHHGINERFFEYYNLSSIEVQYIRHKVDRISIIYTMPNGEVKCRSVGRFGRFCDVGEFVTAERRQLCEIEDHIRKKYVPVDDRRRWQYTKSARNTDHAAAL